MLDVLQRLTAVQNGAQAKPWSYESRREFQSILPFLYLGPFTTAKNINALKNEGITMLLVIRDTRSAMSGLLSGKKAAEQLGIEHAAIDVEGTTQLIGDGFPNAIRLINGHLLMRYQNLVRSGPPAQANLDNTPIGKVLVFCESGNDRSATVVAAYLMATYNINVIAAIQYLQSHRFCVALGDSLKNLLYSYEQVLEARRAVLGARDSNGLAENHLPKQSLKRRFDDLDRDDHDMDSRVGDPDDVARFESRKPFAPFHDG